MCGAPARVSIGDNGVLNREVSQRLSDVWLDRDLGWLDFNDRVLAEALDDRTPLLKRAKLLAIRVELLRQLRERFNRRDHIIPELAKHGVVL
ncbi:MAG TPA: hypothetical protein VEJ47_02945 [Candidatus Eremiobacteraceae bacterium]|nr:hypothetical protein [Candidatus Eremiobacteraceae bacterium]